MANDTSMLRNPAAPVHYIEPDKDIAGPAPGLALCLSGGGYRAMLFHVGALWRLNEAGLLRKCDRISSVSGGSIAAGVLGLAWQRLNWQGTVATDLVEKVVKPIRALAGKTIDAEAIIIGLLTPGSISDKVQKIYEEQLFHGATLQDLPDDSQGPRFVINATNMQSGVLWRFSKPYMADYLVGQVPRPTVRLALAVAASSAFPPVLSPVTLKLQPADFSPDPTCPLQKEPFTTEVVLSDGGVYDNLGLETAWKRYQSVLVSDGGGKLSWEAEPKHDWARHAYRVLGVIDNQVRSLRKRLIIDAFIQRQDNHDGTYWGIRTHIDDYKLPDPLPCPPERVLDLAETPTRLKRLEPERQERLINWGYAVCDAAMRAHCGPILQRYQLSLAPPKFPYAVGV